MAQGELVAMIQSGAITASDLVWTDGMRDWVACGNVPELAQAAGMVTMAVDPASGELSPYAPPKVFDLRPSALPNPPQGAGKATASTVLGAISLVTGLSSLTCCPGAFVAIPCGIIAVVFGNQIRHMARLNPALANDAARANAGRIMGWIGLVVGVLWFLGVLVQM